MSEQNHSLSQRLEQYVNHPSPGYAFLIEGAWGSGKTHFIKNAFIEMKSRADPLRAPYYFSLNGCVDPEGFRSRQFKARFPTLGDDRMKKFLEGGASMLRFRNFDITVFATEKSAVYIIDDIERCEMAVRTTLGLINEMVEHNGCHVIMLMNSKALNGDDAAAWADQNEKLVGIRFPYEANVDEAFLEFVTQVPRGFAKEVLSDQSLVADLKVRFEAVGENNLRAAKRGIDLLGRVLSKLEPQYHQWKEAIFDLSRHLFTFVVGARSGLLPETALSQLTTQDIGYISAYDDEAPAKNFLDASRQLLPYGQVFFSAGALYKLLRYDLVDVEEVNRFLRTHSSFREKTSRPSWQVVWWWTRSSDEDFDEALIDMNRKWDRREYITPGEIIHIAMLRYKLFDFGFIDISSEHELAEQIEGYLEDLDEAGALVPDQPISNVSSRDLFESYGLVAIGGSYDSDPKDRYTKLYNYTKKVILEKLFFAERCKAEEWGAEALKKLIESEEEFNKLAAYHLSSGGKYCQHPIFNPTHVDGFVKGLADVPQEEMLDRIYALRDRYKHIHNLRSDKWRQEVEFLALLALKLNSLSEQAKGIAKLRYKQAAQAFETAQDILEERQNGSEKELSS